MTHALDDGGHRQLKDTVYLQILRDNIVNGVLPPGAVLREAELATRFGVSKTPLRDALVRLQKDGFVEIPPYRSAVVVGYSRTDLREIYELRELLEGACARQAAFHISADALAELSPDRAGQRRVRASATRCVPGRRGRAGRACSTSSTWSCTPSPATGRIDEMVGNIRGHIQRIGRLTTGIPGRLAKSVRRAPGHLRGDRAAGRRRGRGR